MSFGNILGQILQGGLGGQSGASIQNSLRGLGGLGGGAGGSPLDGILAQVQGALQNAQAPGGIGDRARDFMTRDQMGGMSGAQLGGIGALAGALLGGGLGGAARGGAMAVLGTLALNALRSAQAGRAQAGEAATLDLDPADVQAVTSPAAEKLLVRAMISAAKADGNIDQQEMQNIIGKIGADGVTDEEKSFVMAELSAPVDVAALAAAATSPALAAQVYAASLVAITPDTDAERDYLRSLARTLNLDAATVAQLHEATGVALA